MLMDKGGASSFSSLSGDSSSGQSPPPHALRHQIVECCCETLQSCRSALEGGADRIELCSALATEGGLTPSLGVARQVAQMAHARHVTVHAMIRVRGGWDFSFDDDEVQAMMDDAVALRDVVDGFVFGALRNGDVDWAALRKLMDVANGKPVVFHRAFDLLQDPHASLAKLRDAGVAGILTTGGAKSAEEGFDMLASLYATAPGMVIAGVGINEENAAKFLDCGMHIHGSFAGGTKVPKKSPKK